MYCTRCGREIPEGMITCSECDKLYVNKNKEAIINGTYLDKIKVSFEKLNSSKRIFLITICSLILNVIMSFFDMVDISVLISDRSDSFYSLIKHAREWGIGDAGPLLSWLNFGLFLTITSIILTVLPIILQKTYSKLYLIINYVSTIYTFLLYFIIISAFANPQYKGTIEIKATAYLYMIETAFAFLSTIVFARSLKKQKGQ